MRFSTLAALSAAALASSVSAAAVPKFDYDLVARGDEELYLRGLFYDDDSELFERANHIHDTAYNEAHANDNVKRGAEAGTRTSGGGTTPGNHAHANDHVKRGAEAGTRTSGGGTTPGNHVHANDHVKRGAEAGTRTSGGGTTPGNHAHANDHVKRGAEAGTRTSGGGTTPGNHVHANDHVKRAADAGTKSTRGGTAPGKHAQGTVSSGQLQQIRRDLVVEELLDIIARGYYGEYDEY